MKNTATLLLPAFILFLASCSLLDSSDEDSTRSAVQLSTDSSVLAGRTIDLTIDDGRTSRHFSNTDFRERDNPTHGGLATPVTETAAEGTLRIEFKLTDRESGRQVSGGSFQAELKDDWRYSFSILTGSSETDPTEGCFGCMGYFSFSYTPETASAENDSLYIIESGNSISNPVMY